MLIHKKMFETNDRTMDDLVIPYLANNEPLGVFSIEDCNNKAHRIWYYNLAKDQWMVVHQTEFSVVMLLSSEDSVVRQIISQVMTNGYKFVLSPQILERVVRYAFIIGHAIILNEKHEMRSLSDIAKLIGKSITHQLSNEREFQSNPIHSR